MELNLVCMDGWWMSSNALITGKRRFEDPDVTITIDSKPNITMDSDYLKLCGPVVMVNQEIHVETGATFYVAGSITVSTGATLSVSTNNGDMSIIYISEPCSAWVDLVEDPTYIISAAGLMVETEGTIEVIQDTAIVLNPVEDVSTTSLVPLIEIEGCARINGIFKYDADSIPQQNNYFPLTNSTQWTDCIFEVETSDVETTLPSCPIILLELQDAWVVVVTATHRMCAGAIGGLVVGTSAAVAAAAAAAAMMLGAPASSAATDYVML
jgi:hypothetical protein